MTEAKQMQADLGVSQTIELKYPVKLADGKLLERVTVRRPKVGDLRAVMNVENEAEQGLMLVARITGLVVEDLDELDIVDLKEIQATFQNEL